MVRVFPIRGIGCQWPVNEAGRTHPVIENRPANWKAKDTQAPEHLVFTAHARTADQIADRLHAEGILGGTENDDQCREHGGLQRHRCVSGSVDVPRRMSSAGRLAVVGPQADSSTIRLIASIVETLETPCDCTCRSISNGLHEILDQVARL